MIEKLLFRLLPVQIVLAAVGAVNGIVSGFFASNYIGVDAMSAVGLYSPVNMLFTAVSIMLAGGSAILCGKYMGKNQMDKVQGVFFLDLALTAVIAGAFAALLLFLGLSGLTGFITDDAVVRPCFNRYLAGQAAGVFPFLVGSQLPAFLAMENRGRRTTVASVVCIVVNIVLNVVFVRGLRMETLGLALASSAGLWAFFLIQVQYFFTKDAHFRVHPGAVSWEDAGSMLTAGFPGALSNGYQTVRGLIVNWLLEIFVGSVGISAFAAADNLLRIFWAIPSGMTAVSRLMISVSVGEEDRESLTEVMRVMFRRFVPLMGVISAGLILSAVPLTRIFFRDPSQPVYMMTVHGLRILPLCMPLSIICMHFVCYGQASGKFWLVHILSLLDGVVCVAGFTALLIRPLGMDSAYVANVLNGVVTTIVIVIYACVVGKRFPRDMAELMAIPEDFGVPEDERMDLRVETLEDVVGISVRVQEFCLERGIDRRRAHIAALALEEMAGNVIDHGFKKDKKKHRVDVRVVHKDDDVILRIRDDCIPFDPGERAGIIDPEDPAKNIGIRLVFKTARDVKYRNMFGLNVLTVRI